MSVFLLGYNTVVMQEVTAGENWLKGIWDLSVLFLTIACASIISKI